MTLLQACIRIFETFILSSLIGVDREKTRRPAGLRTHVIVALGACLVTICPIMLRGEININDNTRLAAQVLSGIGFLGAGTILRYGENVVGLTTAASLWVSACLGIAAGMGAHEIAIITGLLVVTVLKIVPHLERKFLNKYSDFTVSICMVKGSNDFMVVSNLMKEKAINIRSVNIEMDDGENKIYKFYLSAENSEKKASFMEELYKLDVIKLREYDDTDAFS